MRALLALAAAGLVLTGCGGGGSHTYVIAPSATTGSSVLTTGIYITIVSPVTLPQSVMDRAKNVTFVEHAVGPEICSYSKTLQGVKGKYAYLNGKPLTVKVNGSNPLISLVCSQLKKGPFKIGATATPALKHKTITTVGPIALDAKNLKAESKFIRTQFFWAGPKQGYTYEFTRNAKGYLYVRYLPPGVHVGSLGGHYLIIATYPLPGGYTSLKRHARSKAIAGPGGSIIYVRPQDHRNVLVAFPGVPDQVEIYDPSPATALAYAESGQISFVG